jgi:hypothetical protein
MKTSLLIIVCLLIGLFWWNQHNKIDFTEKEGFPRLGQFVGDKFVPNHARKIELDELENKIILSAENKTMKVSYAVDGFADFIGKDFVLSLPVGDK